MRKTLTRSALAAAATVALAGTAVPAQAAVTTVASWQMNEPAGARTMVDSSTYHINGTVGSLVRTGVAVDGATGYLFPGGTARDARRVVTVSDNAHLDPGTANVHFTVRVRTTNTSANIMQKGQAKTSGGFYKLDVVRGIAKCTFVGSSGGLGIGSRTAVNDGKWHSIKCARVGSIIALQVDSGAVRRVTRASGTISNASPLSIGGKTSCNPPKVNCDYLSGDVDSAVIQLG
jgi:Laminin G domain